MTANATVHDELRALIGTRAFRYGDFVDTLLTFLIIAAVLFFFVVLPVNRLVALTQGHRPPPEPTTRRG